MRIERKEVGLELIGASGNNPYKYNNSSPREAMMTTHIGQSPWTKDAEPRRIMTGIELENAEYDFAIRFPVDCIIRKVVRKYPRTAGADSIRHNPVTAIIYEDYYDPHKTIGIIEVPEFDSMHQDFGYPLVKNPDVWDNLAVDQPFEKGTIIAAPPSMRDDGLHNFGVHAEVAFMSTPATIEDGFEISDEFAAKMSPFIYNQIVANWGRKHIPLNLYGDDNNYKPFPDIGDYIRPDGLVFCLRDVDENLSVADMTPRALREPEYFFDRPLYGRPNARVTDVKVYYDDALNPAHTPLGMGRQADKYYQAACVYYRTLMEEYRALKRKRGKALRITPEFNRVLVEAMMYLPNSDDSKRKLTRMYRLDTLDEYRVEITFETCPAITDANKFTDFHGG